MTSFSLQPAEETQGTWYTAAFRLLTPFPSNSVQAAGAGGES